MAYNKYDKLWRSEFYNNVSAKDKVQDINLNQLKPTTNDTYRKDEKITTNFQLFEDEDVINKAYIDEKLSKTENRLSLLDKILHMLNCTTASNPSRRFHLRELLKRPYKSFMIKVYLMTITRQMRF